MVKLLSQFNRCQYNSLLLYMLHFFFLKSYTYKKTILPINPKTLDIPGVSRRLRQGKKSVNRDIFFSSFLPIHAIFRLLMLKNPLQYELSKRRADAKH